jgi:hypothetical protein
MQGCIFRWFSVAAGLLLLGVPVSGQTGAGQADWEKTARAVAIGGQGRLSYSQDWSSRHLLMPGARAVFAAEKRDPRYVYNQLQRQAAIKNSGIVSAPPPRMKIDWAVSLENGYVPQNQFPAKYQFGIGEEDCDSDYVVYGLTVTSGAQANLVGVNNLYTEGTQPCNDGSPWVAFAYNTVTASGGQIRTSPVLSLDGTMVAFVESTSTASYFHVLVLPNPIPVPPSQAGTVLSPETPTSCTTPTTPGCMTTLLIENSATNSNSSPWVDYDNDTAYVGADNGLLYKITPIFGGGAPALVNDPSNWPVTVSAPTQSNTILTAPVEDANSGNIFLGDGYGYLYSVSLNNPGGTWAAQQTIGWVYDGSGDGSGDPGTGVVDPPIVVTDPANPTVDQVFAFTGCSIVQGIGGAITQLPANFSSGSASTPNTVNLGSASGDGDCTGLNIHAATFDNAFWLYGSTSGHIIECGFVNNSGAPSNPQMYMFPFASGVITSPATSTFVINNTKGDECSPLTGFDDGTADRAFFGVGSTDGYLESSTITSSLSTPDCAILPTSSCVTAPSGLGGTSGIIIDNDVSNGGTNIYFSTLAPGSVNNQNCSVSGGAANPYCAVQLSQSGLN